MDSRRALCPCGRDLGSKRIDLANEHVTRGTCPHCHKRYVIVHGKGRLTVKYER
ncbi:MAG: hypothetical protein IJ849_05500 [Selenomonadaceae bacterium]|nr:hypothetical protein [Selenomonadaceae bacterium]